MAYTSEIDKLERRHRENPEGRTFAPLADAYRKAGDVPRALEVLKAGLQRHPDYLSASIVLGRCHLDLADLPSAESAFQRVLELDKENVIAIKALADITEQLARFDESEHWLNYLLSIDSSNEDARVQLQRLAALREQAANMSMPDLSPQSDDAAAEPIESEMVEAEVAATSSHPGRTVEVKPFEAPELVSPDNAESESFPEPVTAAGFESNAPREAERTEEVTAVRMDQSDREDSTPEADPEFLVVKDDRAERTDTGLDIEREPDEVVSPDVIHLDVGVERHEEIVLRPSSTSEYQVPSDADLLGGSRPSGGYVRQVEASEPAREEAVEPEEEKVTSEGLWQSHPEDATLAGDEAPGLDDVTVPVSKFDGFGVDEEDDPALKSTEAWGAPTLSEDHAVPDEPEEEAPAFTNEIPEEIESAAPDPEPFLAEPELEEYRPEPVSSGSQDDQDEGYPVESEEEEAEPAQASGATPVVTETIADLYAQQGHLAEALVVYRQLLMKSPGDGRLQEKIARLEPPAPARQTGGGFAAAETGGQSVRNYFGDLLSTRLNESTNGGSAAESAGPPEESESTHSSFMEETFRTDPDESMSGEPTRPASGPLSLSAIFGEDSSPVPPVVAGPEHATAPTTGSPFDEFFGERPAAPASTTRTRSVRVDADQDDLDQFHKWLKGLKR